MKPVMGVFTIDHEGKTDFEVLDIFEVDEAEKLCREKAESGKFKLAALFMHHVGFVAKQTIVERNPVEGYGAVSESL